jgi:phosphate transport system substrate-binding protein
MKFKLISIFCAALITASAYARAEAITVDADLENYDSVSGISGNLNSIGSDTLNNLMTYWAEAFKAIYPNVNIQVEGKGSSTAPPALIEGTAQLGPMSRPMKEEEKDKFEKKYGYKPMEVRVAVDALAIYVHKDNPVESLTLKEVDGIFSTTRKQGGRDIGKWGDVGLTGDWANKPISLYGRNSASGTYGYFKDHVMLKGDYKSTVKEQPGSSSVVQGVGSDLSGIGYSGIGYLTSEVRALPIAGADGKPYEPSYENAVKNRYPITRFLYIYVNKKPGEQLDPLVHEFVRFLLSKQGQEIVIKDGYYPLPNAIV